MKATMALPQEKEADDSLSSPAGEPAILSHEMRDPPFSEGPDRKLRNRLILANIAAWIVIGFAIRYFFF
jgi:hypothetical protein